jgi:hypothetical protein
MVLQAVGVANRIFQALVSFMATVVAVAPVTTAVKAVLEAATAVTAAAMVDKAELIMPTTQE